MTTTDLESALISQANDLQQSTSEQLSPFTMTSQANFEPSTSFGPSSTTTKQQTHPTFDPGSVTSDATTNKTLLDGITLTGVVVVSVLTGLSCFVICTTVSVVVLVKKNNRRKVGNIEANVGNQSEATVENQPEATEANIENQPEATEEIQMRDNVAYQHGRIGRTHTTNESHNRTHNTMAFPNRAASDAGTPSMLYLLSMDSEGYVRLPKPQP